MLDEHSIYLRKLILRAMRGGKRGHWGSSASLVEIMRVLYDDVADTKDKIILSKGHGCLAQYVLLVDRGLIPIEELDRFCQKDGMLGGHPAPHVPGVLCHTGALGHGLPIAIGMALAVKIRKQTHRIFVIMGDGEIQEGSVWEAAMAAAKYKLDNLTVIIDYNGLQSSGFVEEVQPLEPLAAKWEAFGFNAWNCDGHDLNELKRLLNLPHGGPVCIIAHTIKGRGIEFAENNPNWHYKGGLTNVQLDEMKVALNQQGETAICNGN